MRIDRIELKRANGIQFDLSIDDLSADVTVLLAPNGKGKSTMCRGLRELLWQTNDPTLLGLELSITVDGVESRYVGGVTSPAVPARLPKSLFAGCYTIDAETLMNIGSSDRAAARFIERELAGGFDFARARKALELKGNRTTHAEKRALREAERDVEIARNNQGAIQKGRERISRFDNVIAHGRRAVQQLETLGKAKSLAETKSKLQAATTERDALSPLSHLARMSDGEDLKRAADARLVLQDEFQRKAVALEQARELAQVNGSIEAALHSDWFIQTDSMLNRAVQKESECEQATENARTADAMARAAEPQERAETTGSIPAWMLVLALVGAPTALFFGAQLKASGWSVQVALLTLGLAVFLSFVAAFVLSRMKARAEHGHRATSAHDEEDRNAREKRIQAETCAASFEQLFGEACVRLGLAADKETKLHALWDRCNALKRLNEALVQFKQAQEQFETADTSWESQFVRFGLEPSDESTRDIERAVADCEGWQRASKSVQLTQAECARLEREIAKQEDTSELNADDLQRRIDEGEAARTERDQLHGQIKQETFATTISECQRKVLAAEEAVTEASSRIASEKAALVLLDRARTRLAEHAGGDLIIGRLRKYVALATNDEIKVTGVQAGENGVVELTVRVEGREEVSAAKLSTGERTLVLLCARVATLAAIENGIEPLPLILDDALAQTDPDRFAAAAQFLLKYAKASSRQLIYMTDEPEDARRWADQAKALSVGCACVDLVKGAALGGVAAPAKRVIPAPESADPAAYALLVKAARPALHDPAVALHVVHLFFDDLDVAYDFLRQRRKTLGSISAMDTIDERIRERIAIAEALLHQLTIGVDRPVAVVVDELFDAKGTIEKVATFMQTPGSSLRTLIAAIENKDTHFNRLHERDEVVAILHALGGLDERQSVGVVDAAIVAHNTVNPKFHDMATCEQLAEYLRELLTVVSNSSESA